MYHRRQPAVNHMNHSRHNRMFPEVVSRESRLSNYSEWSKKSKYQMIEISTTNMIKRLHQIINIVNEETSALHSAIFTLPESVTQQMFIDVKHAILSWKGVDASFCVKQKATFTEYNKTSMNWFNRNKAKLYGNYFFYPLIFVHILNYCNTLNMPRMNNNARISLYLDILISVLTSKIRFPRTKQQPLIPNQTLMQPNKFKTTFIQLLHHFNIRYNPNKETLKCDKQRSNKISKLFVDSLYRIKNKMMIQGRDCFAYQLFRLSANHSVLPSFADTLSYTSDIKKSRRTGTESNEQEPLCSVLVPINDEKIIEYQFYSFDPLFIKENMLSSITEAT